MSTNKTQPRKFRYYITDVHQSNILGTDNRDVAADLAQSEDFFVVDTETGEWMQTDEALEPIKEVKI